MYYVIRDGQVVNTIELHGMAREAYERLEDVLLVEDRDAPEVRIGDVYDETTGTFLCDGVSLAGQIARTMRDNLLKACDYRMMPDFPCSEAARAAWAAYRQALRDLPQQDGFPETVEWPQAPDGADAGGASLLMQVGAAKVAARMTVAANADALRTAEVEAVKPLFDAWAAGVAYEAGRDIVCYGEGDALYLCHTSHTSQADWTPGTATASLWTRIDAAHAGTADDPIPYEGNMALESGKYYSQDGVVYRCTRDTGNPVFQALSELVGLYVEAI